MTELIIRAVTGIGEVKAGDDLAELIIDALDGDLIAGDIVIVTSKIVSKAEGRFAPASETERWRQAETVRTVARRGPVRIVENRLGIVQAAAGIDASNVAPDRVLLLPEDPDASAADLRRRLEEHYRVPLAVIVSDTSGRAWRMGQTDHAIGVSGLAPLRRYAGQTDGYGNRLAVTETAVADELAAAGDLVKGKLAGHPVAIVRHSRVPVGAPGSAVDLLRRGPGDMFRRGTREAVLHAALVALGRAGDYEELVALDPAEATARLTGEAGLSPETTEFLHRLLGAGTAEDQA